MKPPPKDASAGRNAVVARRVVLNQRTNQHIGAIQERVISDTLIKDGKRVRKRAKALEIQDSTKRLHHITVTLETERLQKIDGAWVVDASKNFRLDDDQQIAELVTFLSALTEARERAISGKMLVAPLDADADLASIRKALDVLASPQRVGLVVDFLNSVGEDMNTLQFLTDAARSSPERLRSAVAAINIGRFEAVLQELERLITENAREPDFQRLLSANPWLFGSEYSARHDRRNFVRDQQLDFMLRRTADSHLEIIEIKTPLGGEPLFTFDKDHGSWVPKRQLSAALAQVMHYLEQIDANVHQIYRADEEDLTKVRARIIIGRDGTKEQIDALRRLNGHLHRVEVLTFDMLLRIGRRVVDALRETATETGTSPASESRVEDDDEIPF